MTYRHIKLTTGEEVLCKVMDFDGVDEESLVIHRPYILVSGEDYAKGIRYYTFKPFMMWQEDSVIVLNAINIVAIKSPSQFVIDQYNNHLRETDSLKDEEDDSNKSLDNFVKEQEEKDEGNVLRFNPKDKDKLH